MMESFSQSLVMLLDMPRAVTTQFVKVISYPLASEQRIFWLYLLSSSLFALHVFFRKTRLKEDKITIRGFFKFLFPAKVWQHPSAWLDVRYFFFHQMVRLVIYGALLGAVSKFAFVFITQFYTSSFGHMASIDLLSLPISVQKLVAVISMFFMIALSDFISYAMHYLQHKNKVLWEFHKVHHSAEVMHPLTNYREHPVDNVFYAIGTGMAFGFSLGLFKILFGSLPNMPQILGISAIYFAFNILGYNLRHSHIWFRWPGKISYLFASPAHHQIHHSYHPDHIDKNFAFIFPIWDVLFHTYCLPETNKDVVFGISEDYECEHNSCLGIYFVPWVNTFKMFCSFIKNKQFTMIER